MLNSSSVPLHFFLLVKDANHMNVLSYLVSTYFGSTQMPKIDDDVPSKLYFYVQKENSAEFDGSLTLGTVLKKGGKVSYQNVLGELSIFKYCVGPILHTISKQPRLKLWNPNINSRKWRIGFSICKHFMRHCFTSSKNKYTYFYFRIGLWNAQNVSLFYLTLIFETKIFDSPIHAKVEFKVTFVLFLLQ